MLLIVALAYSAAMVAIGRRLARPASVTAYITAVAVLIAVPLFPEPIVQRVDRVLLVPGVGRLLVHLAFMTALSSLFITIGLATHRWAQRQQLVIGGAGLLMVLFVLCWFAVQRLQVPERAAMFYGHMPAPPPAVVWMHILRGAGIVYIAAWSLGEFQHFLRSARRPYEQGIAGVAIVLYVGTGLAGLLTIVEVVARQHTLDTAVLQQIRMPFTALVLVATAVLLVGQTWLLPLWRHRRHLLLRYVEPEMVQLRKDLLNLSAAEAELHLDIHHELYANRTIVDAVAARCGAAGLPPAHGAIARMATSLITFQRDNLLQDPSYGLVTSWDHLMEEAATAIDQSMAATAWERALRDSYIAQQVYLVMFLVLDNATYREKLLINERPRIQAWHQTLADLIATVMHEHGQSTPRYVTVARQATHPPRFAWLRTRRRSPTERPGDTARPA